MSTAEKEKLYVVVIVLVCLSFVYSCCGFGTFGFDIHHRYSDPVKKILDADGLPEKGTAWYYSNMVARDKLFHGRRLATVKNQTPLTFLSGNQTYWLNALGYLHYVNITVGTPGLSFLAALDTGSDLFWLPCDCGSNCVRGVRFTSEVIEFDIYSPNTSSTSKKVSCDNNLCDANKCTSDCPYRVRYLSDNTESNGYLVEDVLHLETDESKPKATNARILLGCGQVQTGAFLTGAAINGLFGLGMTKKSVPSILAQQGLISNSFSMCFGSDGLGRIRFGDQGSSDQDETPFTLMQPHPTYNVTVTQLITGVNASDFEFYAIFDSGTSFTYLNDPAYTRITESFNSQAREKRLAADSNLPFEYCYALSSNATDFTPPAVNFTMKGGGNFLVYDPIVTVYSEVQKTSFYCLGVVKSDDVNILGQNFMTGYRIVFDREKNVLGWKASDCNSIDDSNKLPVKPPTSPVPPAATAVDPEATTQNSNNSPVSGAPSSIGSLSLKSNYLIYAIAMILGSFLAIS